MESKPLWFKTTAITWPLYVEIDWETVNIYILVMLSSFINFYIEIKIRGFNAGTRGHNDDTHLDNY